FVLSRVDPDLGRGTRVWRGRRLPGRGGRAAGGGRGCPRLPLALGARRRRRFAGGCCGGAPRVGPAARLIGVVLRAWRTAVDASRLPFDHLTIGVGCRPL